MQTNKKAEDSMKQSTPNNQGISLLMEADSIVNDRSQEKERQYGPFSEGMKRATMIFNGMTGLNLTPDCMYKAMIALKLSRESYSHKRDNLLDAVAYIQGLENLMNEEDGKG